MSALDGGIRSLFGTVFGALYLDGTLVRVSNAYATDGTITPTETYQAIKVQQDSVDERTRAEGGYAQNEQRFLILQAGVTGSLDGDCKLIFEGVTYMLSSPNQDPARSYWSVRGVPA